MGRKLMATAVAGAFLFTGFGCGSARTPETTGSVAPRPSSNVGCTALKSFNLIGPSKSGGVNAVNTGECVNIHDLETLGTVGQVAVGGAFVIECYEGAKPQGLRVKTHDVTRDVEGDVELEGDAQQRFTSGEFANEIRPCAPESSPAPSDII